MTKRWAWLDYLDDEEKAAVDHEDWTILWLEERLALARVRRSKLVNLGIQRARLAAKAQAEGRERRPYGNFRQEARNA